MLPKHEVIQVLSHATVFVCPSVYEPMGIVNLEAMACRTAVVATATGGIPEVVADGETGLLVPITPGDAGGAPADPERFSADLARAIGTLLADPARAAAMGHTGRRRVVEHFSWPSIARRTMDVYAELARR
jgi:starch synthase